MSAERTIYLQADRAAPRLDHFLAQEFPDLSRSQLKKLIQQNKVLISDRPVKPNSAVQPGDLITLHLPATQPDPPAPEAIPLTILFEDADLIVVDKPAGLVVHPAHGHRSGTLVNALLARYPDLIEMTKQGAASADRPGIVHRLDQDTSGLIVVARTPVALLNLQRQFKARSVEKVYLALVHGRPEAQEGVIDVPLGRDPRHRQKIAPRSNGKAARTRFRVIESYSGYSLLEVDLETGRTHQIRVHLAWLGCAVVGDTVYGRRRNQLGLARHFLHAWRLCLQHPRTGEPLQFEAPLPEELQAILASL